MPKTKKENPVNQLKEAIKRRYIKLNQDKELLENDEHWDD